MQQPHDHRTDSAEDGHPIHVGGRLSAVVCVHRKSENASPISAFFRAKCKPRWQRVFFLPDLDILQLFAADSEANHDQEPSDGRQDDEDKRNLKRIVCNNAST